MSDAHNRYRTNTAAPPDRTVEAKIERLRQRLRDAPNVDANTRALFAGVLDLLADEL